VLKKELSEPTWRWQDKGSERNLQGKKKPTRTTHLATSRWKFSKSRKASVHWCFFFTDFSEQWQRIFPGSWVF
jgi:hypothetical protein